VAEDGRLRSAAARIHLSPAAVHKHVRLLEQEVDVRLFERSGRGLRRTQALEVLLPRLKGLLSDHESAIQVIDEWKGRKRGYLRIGSGPAAATYLLPPLLARFHARYPGVELYVETASPESLVEHLSTGGIDAVMLMGPFPDSANVEQVAVWRTEIVLVTALPGLPRRCSLADLHAMPFVLFNLGSTMNSLISSYFSALAFQPRVVMRCESSETVKAMTRRGLGVAMLPRWSVDDDLKSGPLRLIRQREAPLMTNVTLLTRRAEFIPRALGAVVEIAKTFRWSTLESL
jgi:DNA-binding transcriptional LysR family regulator